MRISSNDSVIKVVSKEKYLRQLNKKDLKLQNNALRLLRMLMKFYGLLPEILISLKIYLYKSLVRLNLEYNV